MLRRLRWMAPLAVVALGLTACSSDATSEATEDTQISTQADEALAALEGQVLAKGPRGEDPEPASVADLTDDEVAQVQAM